MDSADVSDISNSPAYQSLDELVASGKLTQPQAQLYRSKYAKLHEVVLKTLSLIHISEPTRPY